MAIIKIFDLNSQIFTSNLTDTDLKNINGGKCLYNGQKYSEGSVVRQGGGLYKCNERIWPLSDRWELIGP